MSAAALRGELAELLPEVDIFIGTGNFHKIVDLIKSWGGTQHIEVGKPEYIYDHRTERLHTTARHVAYLKISEGVFHPCSFCIIPKLRGKFRSRPVESILDEAQRMLSDGVKEINLIAQDTTAYWRGHRDRFRKAAAQSLGPEGRAEING